MMHITGTAHAQADDEPVPPTKDSGETKVVPLGGETTEPSVEAPLHPEKHAFEFGSYGRAHFASDLRGRTGAQTNIVAHGTRIDTDDYAELELRREDTFSWNKGPIETRIVATLALFGPFFHSTGKLPDQIAVRNLYVQARVADRFTVWGGSRMYRGDDIYLLNWWPLDNQNTVGGGFGATLLHDAEKDTSAAFHIGQQRLDNPFQVQQVPVVAPFGFGATNVLQLDRPRTIETLKLTHVQRPGGGASGFKVALYGEAQQLSAGVARDPLTNDDKSLPSDSGWLAGSQLTYFTGVRDTYVSLFLRHARGIAAYDPLAVPDSFANDKTTSGSSETTIALGANYEKDWFGLLVGGYMRFFRDGGVSPVSTQKYDEGTLVVRPQAFIWEKLGVALEASYQARRIAVVDPDSEGPLVAQVERFAFIPFFSPSGPGSYKRPQIYGIYAMTLRDSGARKLYPAEDNFSQRKVDHYAGIGVEWWFNSSSYP
jgi:maltoporin